MKTILVPTDFSLFAENALSFAIPIAKKENAKIIIVNAFKIDNLYLKSTYPVQFIEEEITQTERKANYHLHLKCEEIKTKYDVPCEYIGMFGSAAEVIFKVIKEKNPALIVMGTKGATGFSRMILGSNAAKVIGQAPCPVIAVPSGVQYHGIKTVAYVTDLQQDDVSAIRKLNKLNVSFPIHVSIVNIYNGAAIEAQKLTLKKVKENLQRKFANINFSSRLILHKSTEQGILNIARNRHYDLLVMTTRQRSLFESFFDRSLTRKIATSIKIPLLAVKIR